MTRDCRLSRDSVSLVHLKPSVLACSLYSDTCCLTSNLDLLVLFFDVDNLLPTQLPANTVSNQRVIPLSTCFSSDPLLAITMPPKQFNTKASKAHSDSAYEDSEPEPQALRKPRITLKRGKSALNMNETDIPIHSRTRVRKPSPDQIYKDLLSRPAANEPAQDQIYKDLLSRPAANEPAPKRQRASLASTSSVNMAASASSATIAGKR